MHYKLDTGSGGNIILYNIFKILFPSYGKILAVDSNKKQENFLKT